MAFLDFITTLYETSQPIVMRIVVASVLFILGLILGKVLQKALQKMFQQIELNKLVKNLIGVNIALEQIISNCVMYLVYFIFAIWALDQLGVSTLILTVIAAGVIILIVLSIFLGIKDFVPNLIAGIVIHAKNIVEVGDKLSTQKIEGKVVAVDLLATKVQTKEKDILFIPNSSLIRESFTKKGK